MPPLTAIPATGPVRVKPSTATDVPSPPDTFAAMLAETTDAAGAASTVTDEPHGDEQQDDLHAVPWRDASDAAVASPLALPPTVAFTAPLLPVQPGAAAAVTTREDTAQQVFAKPTRRGPPENRPAPAIGVPGCDGTALPAPTHTSSSPLPASFSPFPQFLNQAARADQTASVTPASGDTSPAADDLSLTAVPQPKLAVPMISTLGTMPAIDAKSGVSSTDEPPAPAPITRSRARSPHTPGISIAAAPPLEQVEPSRTRPPGRMSTMAEPLDPAATTAPAPTTGGELRPLLGQRDPTPLPTSTAATETRSAHDFTAIVDRLVEARQTGALISADATVAHRDFGHVRVHLSGLGDELAITLSSPDPGFAPIANAAIREAPAIGVPSRAQPPPPSGPQPDVSTDQRGHGGSSSPPRPRAPGSGTSRRATTDRRAAAGPGSGVYA